MAARGRMHSASLGASRKYAALESDTHRMIYERLIDATDAYGNFDADPVTINGQVLTRLGKTPEMVEAALDDMERVGLITRWVVDGAPYGHIEKFEEHNKTNPSREAQTRIPMPDGTIPVRPERDQGKTKTTKSKGSSGPGPKSGETQSRRSQDSVKTKSGPSQAEVEVEVEVEREVLNPPYPPLAPAVAAPEDEDLTPHQKWKRDKPPDKLAESRLASHHPGVWSALGDLARAAGGVPAPQFAAWAKKVDELVVERGDEAVAAALERTALKAGANDKFAYFLKIVSSPKRGEPDYREVSAAEFLEGSWN